MNWEEIEKDLEAYQAALDAQAAAGADRRVAEGRARSKAIRTWRDANPEAAAAHEAAAPPAAAAAAPAEPAPAAAAPVAAPVGAAVMAAAPTLTQPKREAPLPTGNLPVPKKGAEEKHRLLALVPPEGIQRVER